MPTLNKLDSFALSNAYGKCLQLMTKGGEGVRQILTLADKGGKGSG